MNEAHCWELDRLRHRLQAEEFGHQNFPLIQAVEAAIAALHGSEAGPRRLKHEDIELVEPYLHHLREAAEGWAFEDVDIEQETARRAVIVMSRNVLCLIDELRKLRAEAGPQEAREDVKPHVAMLTAEGYWEIFDELTRRYPELGVCSGLKSAVFQALKLASSGSEAGVSARVLELARRGAYHDHQQLTLLQGHSGPKSFDTCSHPNCVLVRAALGVSPAAE